MPIYILLSRLSQQGVATLKSNPDRLREVNRDVEELGAKVLHQWATLGGFDFVNVVEAPGHRDDRPRLRRPRRPRLDEDRDAARADDRRVRRRRSASTEDSSANPVRDVTPSSRKCAGPVGRAGLSSLTATTRRTVTPHALPDAKSSSGSTSARQPRKCGSGSSAVQPKTAGYAFAGVCSRMPRAMLLGAALGLLGCRALHVSARHECRILWPACRTPSPSAG